MIRRVKVALLVACLAGASLLLACSSSSTPATPTTSPTAPTATQSVTPTATEATATAVPGVLPPASATPIPLPNALQLNTPSRDVVWALVGGERLFRSTDSGDHWQPQALPPSIEHVEVAFIDDQEGWLLSTGPASAACDARSLALWHTGDAGANWTPLNATGIDVAGCAMNLAFIDATHGFVVASVPDGTPIVYRTTDGGRSWSAAASLPAPSNDTNNPGGSDNLYPGRVRGFGGTLLLPVGLPGAQYVYRSTDGGATWAEAARVPGIETGLALLSDSRWLAIGAPDASQRTTDGGTSWLPFTTDYRQASPVTPTVLFGDPEVGYATTRGQIQRTLDGGAHWERITTPGTG